MLRLNPSLNRKLSRGKGNLDPSVFFRSICEDAMNSSGYRYLQTRYSLFFEHLWGKNNFFREKRDKDGKRKGILIESARLMNRFYEWLVTHLWVCVFLISGIDTTTVWHDVHKYLCLLRVKCVFEQFEGGKRGNRKESEWGKLTFHRKRKWMRRREFLEWGRKSLLQALNNWIELMERKIETGIKEGRVIRIN